MHALTAFLDGPDSPDVPNPIHSTAVASQYGFRAALVGGVTVYGWCVPTILEALGEGWLEDGWADINFRRPVYPGDSLAIEVSEGALSLTNQDGERCVAGEAGLGAAPWLDDLVLPARTTAEPRPGELPILTPANAPIGEDLRPMAHDMTPALAAGYADEKQRDPGPMWHGARPRIHPGWIAAQMTPLLHHSYDYGPSIHTRSQIQHIAAAFAGQQITFAGRFRETYERKGHHYAVIDGVMLGESGAPLARLRHTTIFRIAKPPTAR